MSASCYNKTLQPRLLSQRLPKFGDGTCDLINVEQQWAEVSRAGDGHCARVGHRGGSSLGVGGTPVLIGKITGDQQRGNSDSGQLVGEGRASYA